MELESPKLFKTKCKKCKKVIGRDSIVKQIDECYACWKNLKKKKKPKRTASSGFASTKKGTVPDLPKEYSNISFRSGWEMNFARVLCARKIKWSYERHSFTFNNVTRKPFQYIPDFYEIDNDIFWEVKGYLRSQDRSKMRRFKKQYPAEFKKLKACLSKSNKKAIQFYSKIGIDMVYYEDLKKKWESKVAWQ